MKTRLDPVLTPRFVSPLVNLAVTTTLLEGWALSRTAKEFVPPSGTLTELVETRRLSGSLSMIVPIPRPSLMSALVELNRFTKKVSLTSLTASPSTLTVIV